MLALSSNSLTGGIPDGIGNLTKLNMLALWNNSLTGGIPDGIGNLTKLNKLDLSNNLLTGGIPDGIGNLTKLNKLDLSNNSLTGGIPDGFRSLSNLSYLTLSNNNISGEVPLFLCNNTPLKFLILQHNVLEGIIPPCLGGISTLRYLDLSHNKFNGTVTPPLLNLMYTSIYINFSHNNLSGPLLIPQPPYLCDLIFFDMSYNRLCGSIPEFLAFPFLDILDLSSNDFVGEVPNKGIFGSTSVDIFLGNNNVCGGLPKLKLPACPNYPLEQYKEKHSQLLVLKIIAPVVIGVLVCAIALSCFCHWQGKSKERSFSVSLETRYQQVSYQELAEATYGFSSANLIGVGSYGSVYRGFLGPDEEMVAIKVFSLLKRGASKSFLAECQALRNIRHRNLVKIVTACSSIDFNGHKFKALVFDYMPNASLENWLHPRGVYRNLMRSLTFVERLNIAIDVASALEYLHDHCQTPIVHCDLKPSNVLMDSDMTAQVADFGLARFLSEAVTKYSSNSVTSSRLKGTIGYIPPEYGICGKASTQGDVYSYGILLLEMFTRKSPTHEMFKDCLTLHQYAKMALPNNVNDILDPHLVLEGKGPPNTTKRKRECVISIIRIAVSCSTESPKDRMQIKDALKEVQAIRDKFMEVDSRKEIPSMVQLLGE